ncbi:MAG: type IX secretion system sortase PorU [Cyclobacteriaceae bacterium]
MITLKKIWWFFLLWCGAMSLHAQSSVLQTGDWYKVSVEKTGVYRITFDFLKKMGVDPAKINPQHLKIFGREGGMLPQPNAIARPSDLIEIAIIATGEADGKFDKGDYILFYAEGSDNYEYDATRKIFSYENNLYSDQNYYFLTIGPDAGKRIGVSENLGGSFPLITSFDDFAFYEKDGFNAERSGREWFGEKFGLVNSHTLTFNIPGIIPESIIKVVSDVMGQSYTNTSFRLHFNNVAIADQDISAIPNGRYSVKGLHNRDTITINATDVNAANRSAHEVKYEFFKGTGFSQGYLDFVLLNVTRSLSLYDNQTAFLSGASLSNPISTFQISSLTADALIWEITDHYNIKSQDFSLNENAGAFSTSTEQLKKWVVFNNTFPEPAFVSRIDNQDLSGMSAPNLLIITHPAFREEANRLAQHRTSFDNWSVLVVTTEEIYNQFSGGRQDVSALRDFAKYLRDKNPPALKAILLFGKGSYDYKDRLVNNTNFVPTYQSRNSLHPLQSYSSDDYFAFLETSEGSWTESPAQHHTLDVGVGRLPVTSVEEATNVVDKIIDYDTNQKALGSWRKKIVFVADDGNSEDGFTSLHQYQADQLATEIEENYPAVDTRRIFMGTYKKNLQPNGETIPEMADDIKRAFDQGALIINFTGHGSEFVWTDERILTEKTIAELKNDRYPFLVTATCEFGRQDDPFQISSAERSVTLKGAGAIGLVTTARPVNATTNFNLNEAFYESLFEATSTGYATIGEVFQKTKNNSISGVANRNFSLIGDPSMVLALPEYSIQVNSVKTSFGSDTLKALSMVTTKGEVHGLDGLLAGNFNGVVEATLFDKEKEFVTIGKNNPPFEYRQWDNAVFRGKATVKDGKFEFTFVMPKNIAYQVGEGKFSMYAFDPQTQIDAKGVDKSLRIGGSESVVSGDATPPAIRLFMGDTTFVNGGVTSPDTYLIAELEDENGINISGYGIGNSIVAQLDEDAGSFILNDYYISAADTYKKGSIRFPILGLTPGQHVLTVNVWDVHNNPAEASIAFLVTDGETLVIEDFGNYPNPFNENTTVFFTHNRSGDDLKAQLFIYSMSGQRIKSGEISIGGSEYHVNLMELDTYDDSGKKLPPGLYLARLIVRSMTNGSKNEKVTKLIVVN